MYKALGLITNGRRKEREGGRGGGGGEGGGKNAMCLLF